MNLLLIFVIIAVVVVYLIFRSHDIRAKVAFFFILFGVLFLLLFLYLMINGSGFNFAGVTTAAGSLRVYFLWIKGVAVNLFQVTGKAIGLHIGNSTTG